MKNQLSTGLRLAVMLFLIFGLLLSCSKEMIEKDELEFVENEIIANQDLIEGSYIVIVSNKPAAKNSKAASALEELTSEIYKKPGANVNHVYKKALTGFAAQLTDKQIQELRKDPRVEYIQQDHYLYLDNTTATVQEYVNWGLDRIDQREGSLDRAYAYTATGKGVTVYVMDSGIRNTHVEFGSRVSLGYDFSLEDPHYGDDDADLEPGTDCYGHGTPVAGIIGGVNYGVAKDVNLINVKVFACNGWATASTIVAAVEWVTQYAERPAIVNASFGYPETETVIDIAVENSIETGIHYSISAGNNNSDACRKSPSVSSAITVGATNIKNEMASFSNYGDCVDVYAPSVNTKTASQLDDTSSRLFSGTSAAAPYVAGVMALYLEIHPEATPAEVQAAIKENSTANAVTNVPSGTNNMIYSLWEPVEFTPPSPPNLNLTAVGERIRGRNYINLTWTATEAPYIKVYENGIAHFPEHFNDGEQQISTGDRDKDITYIMKICEGVFDNCSEEIKVVFGNGSEVEDNTNQPPKADFTYNANLLQVQFADASTDTDGSINNWNWNFGDGTTSSSQDPIHTYSEAGNYEVALTVTDDSGDTGSILKSVTVNTGEPEPDGIVLTATGYKVKGAWNADLSWNYSGTVDIYRDGEVVATITSSSGTYTDVTGFKGSGSLIYKICAAGGTSNCSNEVTVQF